MSKTHSVYGGTFDPPSAGHLHIIRKACKIFDIVTVVIAQNPNKKTLFSLQERKEMVKDMVKEFNVDSIKVEVKTLPNDQYLVNYAYSIGANFMVRGIRDNLDFLYEQNICITNKRIQKEIETVYLIPDESYGIISSSWVKGLVGMKGWRKVIKDYVTPFTLMKLEEKFLRDEFLDVCKKLNIFQQDFDDAWGKIVNGYSKNAYHNFDHIMDGIEAFKSIEKTEEIDPRKTAYTLYAWFMHDVSPSEDESIEIALSYLPNSLLLSVTNEPTVSSNICKLIQATKHKTCKYETEDEEIFASIDLLCLSGYFYSYDEYISKVYNEYLTKSGLTKSEFYYKWIDGRSKFLEGMLEREKIYPCIWIGARTHSDRTLEAQAKRNIQRELNDLNSGKTL